MECYLVEESLITHVVLSIRLNVAGVRHWTVPDKEAGC